MNKNRLFLIGGGLVVAVALFVLAAALFGLFTNPLDALKRAARNIEREDDRLAVQAALVEFQKSGALEAYFDKCYGCAVFPTIGKGGLVVGGAHGAGWVFRGGRLKGLSKMTQVTVGFQAGAQTYSQIIFFEDERAYTKFTGGNFEFGAQASAVALTVGANAAASTAGGASAGAGSNQSKSSYTDGMAVFTLTKGGLMYEASLGGQKFSYADL